MGLIEHKQYHKFSQDEQNNANTSLPVDWPLYTHTNIIQEREGGVGKELWPKVIVALIQNYPGQL